MALGTNTSFGDTPLVFLTPRAKDKEGNKLDQPYFSVGRVDKDGKIQQTEERPTTVSGDLVSLDIKERKFKTPTGVEEIRDEVSLYFKDANAKETYRLPLGFMIAPRGVFNSLISLKESKDFTGIEIDYYRNRGGYDTYAVKQRGEKVSWAFKLEELPEAKKIADSRGKVIKTDFYDVDEFFKKHLLEIAAILNGGKKKEEKKSETTNVPAGKSEPVKEDVPAEESTDEVPF